MDITTISKEEYLKAIDIVRAYTTQQGKRYSFVLDTLLEKSDLEKSENLTIGDIITQKLWYPLDKYFNRVGLFNYIDLPFQELSKITKKEFLATHGVGFNSWSKLESLCEDYGIELKK